MSRPHGDRATGAPSASRTVLVAWDAKGEDTIGYPLVI